MSQTTETPQPTNAELVAQVVGAVTAVQDAEAVLVEGAKNLADHIADPNAHGRDVAACIAGLKIIDDCGKRRAGNRGVHGVVNNGERHNPHPRRQFIAAG